MQCAGINRHEAGNARVLRERSSEPLGPEFCAVYREVHGDRIENAYTLKVINLDRLPHSYRLQVAGMDRLEIAAPLDPILVPPGSVAAISARLQVPGELAAGVHTISLTLTAVDVPRLAVSEKARFIGPNP